MSAKQKTMHLRQDDNPRFDRYLAKQAGMGYGVWPWQYIVEKVVNSLEPTVGFVLSKDEAQVYIDRDDWTVNILPTK